MEYRIGKGIGCAFLILMSNATMAATTNLGSYGKTQLQQDTGDAVQSTCGGFVAQGFDPNYSLFATCRAMVHTGNALTGTGAAADSLGLSEDQLASSLQQIAAEEFLTTGSVSNELATEKATPVLSRLSTLRSGTKGFSLSNLTPLGNPDMVVGAPQVQRGGSAGVDGPGSPLSGFATFDYGFGSRDGTANADEFDFDSYHLVAGLDYQLNPNFVIDAAIGYFVVDSEFKVTSDVAGGDTEIDGFSVMGYFSWYSESFYVDGFAGLGTSDYDMTRHIVIPSATAVSAIDETAISSTDSDDYTISVGGGYMGTSGSVTWQPYLRVAYSNTDIAAYDESGADASGLNLHVDGQEWSSLTSSLGIDLSNAVSKDFGVLIPFLQIGWIHEFENDETTVTAFYIDDLFLSESHVLAAGTDEPDQNYFELGFGISAVFKNGQQLFFKYDSLLGLKNVTSHLVTLGARWEF